MDPLIALCAWFAALALMMWRWPHGDRFHVRACLIGGAIWLVLPLLEPTMRSWGYAGTTGLLFSLALFRNQREARLAAVQQSPSE